MRLGDCTGSTMMSDRSMHVLIPVVSEVDARRRENCATDDHPPTTWNPLLGQTFCRCGVAQYPGNHAPVPRRLFHAVTCTEVCDWSCELAWDRGLSTVPNPEPTQEGLFPVGGGS